ncbi:lysophospholipid acyltransferase family protein [Spirosoma foliorum]|uniref:Lysophospholipid acyltransferase family protein n=1 Tax=Spirosoma foliorum TaxID=2710596 RepID=A0A7G5H5U1_9BACT|nr:lysophospholipid acyltransferase family protein [Spirosoma foliorum]QMW06483.1 lysophospholipid acyltransferase family protein [Spirosoma foliorum]
MIFFRLLSRLPLKVLYGISDVLYFLLFRVIRYRRQVILDNLEHSFPEKSPAEIRLIMKGFYHNLADLFVETLKLPTFSPDELQQHVRVINPELVLEQIQAGKTAIAMTSHQGNWEWLPGPFVLKGIPVDSVYKPLTNPFFNDLMYKIRSSFGAVPTDMHLLPRQMVARKDTPRLIGLMSDQVPDVPEQAYWTDFLHRDTPFYPGAERLARSRNLPVFYMEPVRVRRGYYEISIQLLAEPPYTDLPPGTILERYRDRIEDTIKKYPSDWLWSHKRWKHWRGKYAKVGAKLE